jgi:hypothetical protein
MKVQMKKIERKQYQMKVKDGFFVAYGFAW